MRGWHLGVSIVDKRLGFVAAVALSALLSVAATVRRRAHVVPEADLVAAATALRRDFRAGDVIVVEPWTQVGPLRALGDLPLWLGPRLDRGALRPFGRVHLFELDVLGASDDDARALAPLPHGDPQRFGAVRFTTFTLPQARPMVLDAYRDVAQLRVSARYADGVQAACDRFDRDRWLCPRDSDWSWVGRAGFFIDGALRACLWLHPLAAGGRLQIDLPPAPPTAHLVIAGGFSPHGARSARAPVQLRVVSGEERRGTTSFAPGDGWHEAAVTSGAPPWSLEVESRDNGAAHFCAQIWAEDGGP